MRSGRFAVRAIHATVMTRFSLIACCHLYHSKKHECRGRRMDDLEDRVIIFKCTKSPIISSSIIISIIINEIRQVMREVVDIGGKGVPGRSLFIGTREIPPTEKRGKIR